MKSDWTFEQFIDLLRQDNAEKDGCVYEKAFELFQGKWNIRVLYELSKCDTMRFGQIQKAIPRITNTMLVKTLKELEQMGIVQREQFNEIPPHVEYSLSESGKALLPVFYEIVKWASNYLI